MAQDELRIDATRRRAEEFIAEVRHAAAHMVATAKNEQAWMDAHMPRLEAEKLVEWLQGSTE